MKTLITALLLLFAPLGAAAQSTYGTTTVSFSGTAASYSKAPLT